MTREQVAEWRAWLERVQVRVDCDDVPILIRRLGRALDELEPRLAAGPTQLRLEDVA